MNHLILILKFLTSPGAEWWAQQLGKSLPFLNWVPFLHGKIILYIANNLQHIIFGSGKTVWNLCSMSCILYFNSLTRFIPTIMFLLWDVLFGGFSQYVVSVCIWLFVLLWLSHFYRFCSKWSATVLDYSSVLKIFGEVINECDSAVLFEVFVRNYPISVSQCHLGSFILLSLVFSECWPKGFYFISSHMAFTGNCSENALHSIFSSSAHIGSV